MIGVAIGIPFGGAPGVIIGVGFAIGGSIFGTLVPIAKDIAYHETQEEIQTQMNSVNSEIGMVNSTIALLQQLDKHFSDITAQTGTSQGNIKQVLQFWDQVEASAKNIVTDLTNTLNEGNIDQAITDLQTAAASWSRIEGYMQDISKITYNIDTSINLAPSVEELMKEKV
jgi:hypothetical protein